MVAEVDDFNSASRTPAAQQIGVGAVSHRHGCHGHARLHATGHGAGLELIAVIASASAQAGLLIEDSVHVSTKSCDGYEAPMFTDFLQDGSAGRSPTISCPTTSTRKRGW